MAQGGGLEMMPTPIISHEFRDGDIYYLVGNDESEPVWVKDDGINQDLIDAYWNNMEVIDKQDQREIYPGELIALIPNAYCHQFNFLIQRETDVDPLMLVPREKAKSYEPYVQKYIDLIEEIYQASPEKSEQLSTK